MLLLRRQGINKLLFTVFCILQLSHTFSTTVEASAKQYISNSEVESREISSSVEDVLIPVPPAILTQDAIGVSENFLSTEESTKVAYEGFFAKKGNIFGKKEEVLKEAPLKNLKDFKDLTGKIKYVGDENEGYRVNFDNIAIVELIQFVSKITGINYIFDHNDIKFNVTIVSHEPTSADNLSAILLQVLKMHNLSVSEQGKNVLIYRHNQLSKISEIVTKDNTNKTRTNATVTRVFKLEHNNPVKVMDVVKPLLSVDAVISPSVETGHLVISDIAANVTKIAELLSILDAPEEALEFAEYVAQHGNIKNLTEYARELLNPLLNGTPFQVTYQGENRIFIISSANVIKKAKQVLESLDKPEIASLKEPSYSLSRDTFFMYKLKHHKGSIIAKAIQDIGTNLNTTVGSNLSFVECIKSVQWVESNNSLIITGAQDAINQVVRLLEDLDRAPKQVFIEVLILDTTLRKSLDFGVQWVALGEEDSRLGYATGLLSNKISNSGFDGSGSAAINNGINKAPSAKGIPLPNPDNMAGFADFNSVTSAFGVGILGNIIRSGGKSFLTLGALISALDQDGDSLIVLNPKIMTEDSHPAYFFVGQNVPYLTTNTVVQQTGSVSQNFNYDDVGITLKVVPNISSDNTVSLTLEQTISELTSTIGVLTPTTVKTVSNTKVHVPDGCFLVMSGHIRDKTETIHSGVPFLKSLPIIGTLFSRNIEQRSKRNLMLFIRPKVITTLADGHDITEKSSSEFNWNSDRRSLGIAPVIAPERADDCEDLQDFSR